MNIEYIAVVISIIGMILSIIITVVGEEHQKIAGILSIIFLVGMLFWVVISYNRRKVKHIKNDKKTERIMKIIKEYLKELREKGNAAYQFYADNIKGDEKQKIFDEAILTLAEMKNTTKKKDVEYITQAMIETWQICWGQTDNARYLVQACRFWRVGITRAEERVRRICIDYLRELHTKDKATYNFFCDYIMNSRNIEKWGDSIRMITEREKVTKKFFTTQKKCIENIMKWLLEAWQKNKEMISTPHTLSEVCRNEVINRITKEKNR